jgi:predicted ArsR family transcriptional regulator
MYRDSPMAQSVFDATTKEAATQLRISDATLRRLRQEGVLKAGVHYRAMGSGVSRPPLLWNVAASDLALAQRSRRVLTGRGQG